MVYGLVYFPNIDFERINRIRKKYDPTVKLIDPHITIMFPVPDSVGEGKLEHHIESVLKRWRPFPIHICGFRKSWDHWLFLTLQEGNSDVIRLYSDIYTEMLSPYRREDIEFVPHIALGLFVKESAQYNYKDPKRLDFDEERFQQVLQEAEVLGLNYHCVVDKLHLVKLTDDFARIVSSKAFSLTN
ncbi:hypothetical protein GWN42_10255 [candidate division KSB1 bacterium]|nr:hypothetical protein [candidate division KSB1 bacterium]